MPPLHEYRCKACKKEVEVIRSFKDFDKQPEEKCDCPEGTNPDWKKYLSKSPQAAFAGNWAGKGNWAVLFVVPLFEKLGGLL